MENTENTVVEETTQVEEAKVAEPATEDIEALKIEMAKLKKAFDKASSEASSYKKQLRDKQTADEIAAQEKAEKEAEREEAYQKLLKESTVTKYEKNFLSLGYGDEFANKAALAQYEGDTEALFNIQKQVMEKMQKSMKAELTKSMPTSPISNDSDVSMTQAEFDKLSLAEQVELKNKDYELWKKFA